MSSLRREQARQLLRLAKRDRSAAPMKWDLVGRRFVEIYSNRDISLLRKTEQGIGLLVGLLFAMPVSILIWAAIIWAGYELIF
jgi:hypothetical protein